MGMMLRRRRLKRAQTKSPDINEPMNETPKEFVNEPSSEQEEGATALSDPPDTDGHPDPPGQPGTEGVDGIPGESLESLRAKAKALGVKYVGSMGEETLLEKIAEAERQASK
jgi:hypothetical protein